VNSKLRENATVVDNRKRPVQPMLFLLESKAYKYLGSWNMMMATAWITLVLKL
jgi:hypothetical protein